MPQKKRTASNPPAGLLNAVINQSQSNVFEEAVKEWKMLNYFHEPDFKTCVCGPADVSNFTVIMNVKNRNCMEICNSCAERHFAITLSSEIERVVRRIRSNSSRTINDEILNYMTLKQIIDQYEKESYQIIRSKRDVDITEQLIIARLNLLLLAYTTYKNKQALDYINSIVAWSISNENLNHRALCAMRRQLLNNLINAEDIMRFREMTSLHYEPTYDEVVQTETMMSYIDPKSEKTWGNIVSKYDRYARIQEKLEKRRKRQQKLAEAKESEVIYLDRSFFTQREEIKEEKFVLVVAWEQIVEWDTGEDWNAPIYEDDSNLPYFYENGKLWLNNDINRMRFNKHS